MRKLSRCAHAQELRLPPLPACIQARTGQGRYAPKTRGADCPHSDREHIDSIYASDLKRAYNTSLPTARAHGIEVIKRKELREVNAGNWENKLFTELIEQYPESYGNTWLNNIGMAHPDGGESVEELRLRVCAEIERIARANDGKTVAIFTHATPIRAFCATVHSLIGPRMHELAWVSNATLTRVKFEDGKFTLTDYGNEEHLGSLITRLPKTV